MLVVSVAWMGVASVASLWIARTLPLAEYGRWAYFSTLLLLVQIVAALGVGPLTISELARARHSGMAELRHVWSSMLALRLSTLLPFLLLGAVAARVSDDPLYWHAALAGILATAMVFLTATLQALERTWRTALVYLVQPAAFLALVLALRPSAWQTAAVAIETSYALAALVAAICLWGTGLGWPAWWHVSWSYARGLAGALGGMYVVELLQLTFSTYALVWLGATGRYTEAAQLNVAWTLMYLLPQMLAPFFLTSFYAPLCAAVARGDVLGRNLHVAAYFERVAALLAAGMALLLCFPAPLIGLLYTDKYAAAVPLLAVLAPLSLALGLQSLLTLALIAQGQRGAAVALLAGRLALYAVLAGALWLLDPPAFALAVAGVYLLAGGVALVVQVLVYGRVACASLPLGNVAGVSAACIVLALAARLLLPDVVGPPWLELYKAAVAGLAIGLLLAWRYARELKVMLPGSRLLGARWGG